MRWNATSVRRRSLQVDASDLGRLVFGSDNVARDATTGTPVLFSLLGGFAMMMFLDATLG